MKTADFSAHLTEFLSHYLPELKNISTNTISSYCDAFRLFLGYCQDVEGMRIEKLSIDDLTPELVDHFLQWLRIERNNGTATRSQRLAAIRSFVKYLQIKEPRLLLNFQQILAIPVKRAEMVALPSQFSEISLMVELSRPPRNSTLSCVFFMIQQPVCRKSVTYVLKMSVLIILQVSRSLVKAEKPG